MTKGLPIPTAVNNDNNAIELLRVWAANGKQHIVIEPSAWDDPAAWGIMLADLAKHISQALCRNDEQQARIVLARIKEGLLVELENPTE